MRSPSQPTKVDFVRTEPDFNRGFYSYSARIHRGGFLMAILSYHDSQRLIAEAEVCLRTGRTEDARELFGKAGRTQRAFGQSIGPNKVRTCSVFGLSAATLLYRG